MNLQEIQRKSKDIKLQVLDIAYKTGRGHIGSSFSIADILVTIYYTDLFDLSKDVLLMGKGHACLNVFCILHDFGVIDDAYLAEYGTNGGRLGIQFDTSTPTIKYNTGSLGHVFGIGVGLRMSNKYRNVYAIVGDGECEEGSIWETADFAAHVCGGPMILIVDRNHLGVVKEITDDRLEEKFRGFGLFCETIDGHNHQQIYDVLRGGLQLAKPLVVIADTVKGKGISFMENSVRWHAGAMSEEQYNQATKELQDGY